MARYFAIACHAEDAGSEWRPHLAAKPCVAALMGLVAEADSAVVRLDAANGERRRDNWYKLCGDHWATGGRRLYAWLRSLPQVPRPPERAGTAPPGTLPAFRLQEQAWHAIWARPTGRPRRACVSGELRGRTAGSSLTFGHGRLPCSMCSRASSPGLRLRARALGDRPESSLPPAQMGNGGAVRPPPDPPASQCPSVVGDRPCLLVASAPARGRSARPRRPIGCSVHGWGAGRHGGLSRRRCGRGCGA